MAFRKVMITGLREIEANINKEIASIEDASIRGLVGAAAHLRKQTDKIPPKVPVDWGNLRASWFTVTAKGSVAAGKGTSGFRGPKGQEIANHHDLVVSDAKGEAARLTRKGRSVFVVVGYSANYAAAVHEGPGGRKDVQFKREGAAIKWLQTHMEEDKGEMLEKIKEEIRMRRR